MKYIKYILYGVIFLLAYVIGLVLVPILYPFRKRGMKVIKPFWYFLNDTVYNPNDKGNIDWGDYGRFKHNFVGFYMQNAIRNSHWNLKLLLAPKKGNKENVKGNLEWRRANLKGTQNCTYEIEGTKYFRFSHSNNTFYCQFGASDDRYIYKIKKI